MNPILFNCILLYLSVIFLSLLQSRFSLIKDNPVSYIVLVLITPFIIAGKLRKIRTWTAITGFEIFGYTLIIAYINVKSIVPRINEGYVYAYTLFHWYLLIDTINIKGLNFWKIIVAVISLYPTVLIVKSAFEFDLVNRRNKIILYYWFLFTVAFTYINQVALDIVQPIIALYEINFTNTLIVLTSAVQLYFISTILSLIFIAIPVFHLDRSGAAFKTRWRNAMRDWKEVLKHKLDNYIDYQISNIQVLYITIISGVLFYIDAVSNFRPFLILIYTVVIPLIFFYLKWTPEKNIDPE